MNFKISDGKNCSPVVLLCPHSPKPIPEMNEDQENRVAVRGRNENTATPQSAHTEFKNCMGRVTA